MFRFFILLLFVFFGACKQSSDIPVQIDSPGLEATTPAIKGALLATRFKSLEALKNAIQIEYFNVNPDSGAIVLKKQIVRLTHRSNGMEVVSILKSGVSDTDFVRARDGGLWKRIQLGFRSPYFVRNRKDLLRVYTLARRNFKKYGEGDAAFFDIAQAILYNISDDDLEYIYSEDLSEKGYFNSFNHITAQVIITSLFSEELADFIADAHERGNMPELITGNFTEDQLADLEKGPIDNYVDMINNEWGQELGKVLRKKYRINRDTHWTPELLASYLNDVLSYYTWSFQIGFKPFTAENEKLINFSNKINKVMRD